VLRQHAVVAFDTETALIRPALLAPPLVCLSWQEPGQSARIVHVSTAEPIIRQWLESDCVLVGHNVAYDLAVICERFPHLRSLVFKAYANDRVTDTMIRQWQLDVAGGVYRGRLVAKDVYVPHKYALEDLAKRCAGMVLQKDGWRLSYSEFLDTPLADWPSRAREVQAEAAARLQSLRGRLVSDDEKKAHDAAVAGLVSMVENDPMRCAEYPLDDARATLAVYLAQEKHSTYLQDQFRQARAYWALHLQSVWGLRTDAIGVELLRNATQAAYDGLEEELIQLGLVRDDKKRTRDTKAAKARMIRVCREEGVTLRRTDGHSADSVKCKDAEGNPLPGGDARCAEHVCLDADACDAVEDIVIKNYSELSTLKKVLTNDVEALAKGVLYPVHTRYGFAATGRTTSSNPNIQSLRRLAGIREAFVPRPGMVFFNADYPALEAYTWAQCCVTWLGQSKLAEALNGGLDPHLSMAANILGVSYEVAESRYLSSDQEVKDIRQLAKVANFGFPGGMGPATMLASAKKQLEAEVVARLGLDLERMELLKEEWMGTWPESEPYFARVKSSGPQYPEKYRASVETLFTKRFRGEATYCAACNNGFQGLGADCAKEAAWRICREQYDVPSSPLYNTRTVAFVHDEFVGEALEATAHEAAMRLADVMVEGANIYLPDVKIPRSRVKPLLMRRWSKDAEPVLGSDGRLIPWAI
jgi:DNA polymerase-1